MPIKRGQTGDDARHIIVFAALSDRVQTVTD